jgi:hypothetical protein
MEGCFPGHNNHGLHVVMVQRRELSWILDDFLHYPHLNRIFHDICRDKSSSLLSLSLYSRLTCYLSHVPALLEWLSSYLASDLLRNAFYFSYFWYFVATIPYMEVRSLLFRFIKLRRWPTDVQKVMRNKNEKLIRKDIHGRSNIGSMKSVAFWVIFINYYNCLASYMIFSKSELLIVSTFVVWIEILEKNQRTKSDNFIKVIILNKLYL